MGTSIPTTSSPTILDIVTNLAQQGETLPSPSVCLYINVTAIPSAYHVPYFFMENT